MPAMGSVREEGASRRRRRLTASSSRARVAEKKRLAGSSGRARNGKKGLAADAAVGGGAVGEAWDGGAVP